ncbi:hypothetical protein CVT26_008381 [Gymnopilus dilepis]|uniref:Uncharacterized protein n=1 Tax=Gymnopilus dilepis TaxID=231916 RepID=A0A409XY51_9AGAR|nr:hypothetical protein CVT26_008381 [Gymnopilus dilepis]
MNTTATIPTARTTQQGQTSSLVLEPPTAVTLVQSKHSTSGTPSDTPSILSSTITSPTSAPVDISPLLTTSVFKTPSSLILEPSFFPELPPNILPTTHVDLSISAPVQGLTSPSSQPTMPPTEVTTTLTFVSAGQTKVLVSTFASEIPASQLPLHKSEGLTSTTSYALSTTPENLNQPPTPLPTEPYVAAPQSSPVTIQTRHTPVIAIAVSIGGFMIITFLVTTIYLMRRKRLHRHRLSSTDDIFPERVL